MKRSERHHLKENEVALSVARATEFFDQYKNQVVVGGTVIAGVIGIVLGVLAWRQYGDNKARTDLAAAMAVAEASVSNAPASPGAALPAGTFKTEQAKLEAALAKFVAVANQYPSTQAGIVARYKAGSTLVALGRYTEAER